jgi:hypothetical protein
MPRDDLGVPVSFPVGREQGRRFKETEEETLGALSRELCYAFSSGWNRTATNGPHVDPRHWYVTMYPAKVGVFGIISLTQPGIKLSSRR